MTMGLEYRSAGAAILAAAPTVGAMGAGAWTFRKWKSGLLAMIALPVALQAGASIAFEPIYLQRTLITPALLALIPAANWLTTTGNRRMFYAMAAIAIAGNGAQLGEIARNEFGRVVALCDDRPIATTNVQTAIYTSYHRENVLLWWDEAASSVAQPLDMKSRDKLFTNVPIEIADACIVVKVTVFNRREEMHYIHKLARGKIVTIAEQNEFGYYIIMTDNRKNTPIDPLNQ
jgi:hypothetical protein